MDSPFANNHRPVGRRTLDHESPIEVSAEAIYFVTICCESRGRNFLCKPAVRDVIFGASRHYTEQGKWFMHLLLLMPDHVHFLVSPGREHKLADLLKPWKSFIAKRAGVKWQRDWFDHRLRSDESYAEKEAHILNNPLRKGLTQDAKAWPYFIRGEDHSRKRGDTHPDHE